MADLNKKSQKKSKDASLLEWLQANRVKAAGVIAGVLVFALAAGYAAGMFSGGAPAGEDNSIALAQTSNDDENAEALPQETRTYADPFMISTENDPFVGPMKLVGVLLDGRGHHLAIIEAGGTAYVVPRGAKIADYWTVLSIKEKAVELRSDEKDMTLQLVDR